MLTRLKVNGWKNLVDVDVELGPFTCIAGVNGVGKSNLFDAITFLSALADKPLLQAALSVRSEGGQATDVRSIFHRIGGRYAEEMSFEAEMLIPESGVDDLGQAAKAAITFLRYGLTLRRSSAGLTIRREELAHITLGRARSHLRFPHSLAWRESVVTGRRTSPFISTEESGGTLYIKLHQDLGENYKGGGSPRSYIAEKLPRTVLSDANSADSRTAVLARREMQSWRLLQLEPSGLRQPDSFMAPRSIAANGAHLPATLARLTRLQVHTEEIRSTAASMIGEGAFGNPSLIAEPTTYRYLRTEDEAKDHAAAVYARVANRLSELIERARSVRVDVDDRRELLTLMLTERDGTEHEARSLSDGTLRFLALAILESDAEASGVLCMEEPENGIHPERISAMLRLLQDLAVDPTLPVDGDNPLRQVIVNTHSPSVAAQVPEGSLLVALSQSIRQEGQRGSIATFRWLPGTWREEAHPDIPTVPLGQLLSYLNPLQRRPTEESAKAPRRVIDRDDLQELLPFAVGSRPA